MRNVGGMILSVGILFSTLGVGKCNDLGECSGIAMCIQALPPAPRYRFEQELPVVMRVSLGDREIRNECVPADPTAPAPAVTRVDARTVELDGWSLSWLPIEGSWPVRIESAAGCAEGEAFATWTEGTYSRAYDDAAEACTAGCGTWKEEFRFSLPGAQLDRGAAQTDPLQQ